jgi:hypothetical protein
MVNRKQETGNREREMKDAKAGKFDGHHAAGEQEDCLAGRTTGRSVAFRCGGRGVRALHAELFIYNPRFPVSC